MSNWDNVSATKFNCTAQDVSIHNRKRAGVMDIDVSGADIQQVVESIGPEEILHGLGVEYVRQWLEEQDADQEQRQKHE